MNRVLEIANTYFDFGGTPQSQTQASETTTSITRTTDNSSGTVII